MIEPHRILNEVFAQLPTIQGLQANYKWGDSLHLNKILKLYGNEQRNPYPLIYNISNNYEVEKRTQHITYRPLSLVLATRNEHTDWTNGNRWATSYDNILFPLADYILQVFKKSQVFNWDSAYKVFEYPNYSNTDEKKENATTDIWDALRIDVASISIFDRCPQPILFKEYQSELTT
jgi:hypothetical protein